MSDSSSNNSSSSNKSDNSSPPDSSSSSNNSNSNSNSAPSKNSPPDSALSTDSSSSNSNSDNASPNSSNSLSSSSDSPPSNNSPADSSKSDSSSSNSNGSTSPPSDGDNGDGGNDSSSPTNESKAAAPSKDDSSSSPLPPSSSSKSSPPPPQSNSDSSSSPSSKSESDSSPPPPSKSNKSPPPPSQGNESSPPSEGSSSPPKSPPPPAKQDSSSPPSQNSESPSPPPPKSTSPPKEDSGNSTSPPDESSESYPPSKKKSPPPPDDGSSRSSPSKEDSPPPPPKHRDRDSTPSSSRDSAKSPKLSPSKGNGKDGQNDSVSSPTKKSSDSPTYSSGSDSGSVVGATVACVIFIVLIAIFFIMRSKRKRRNKMAYTTHFGPVSDQFSVRTDGYYYGPKGPQQQHQVAVPTHSQEYYGKPPPNPSFGLTSGFGSTRGPVNMGPDSGTFGNSQSCFSYKELVEITRGFAGDNIIGEGGFGCVHKGQMADGRLVAVKQLKVGSGQGEREFRAEVEIISRVHHRHLVSLVGYCLAEHHRLLVYEFVPNKTLEYHLHEVGLTVMEWSKRVKIAIGAARGLAYLHEDCHPKIIHRDIKSANILVDNDFEAQVADFGLAKLSTDTYTHVSTRVMGTFGYLAPEYAASGKLTDRSDVYSFGVVLLEIVTGRKPVDQTQPLGDESLVEWARPLLGRAIQTGDVSELVDPRLEKKYVESEMYRMIEAAAACVRHSAPKRPRMVQVLRALDTDGDMPDLTNGVKYGQSTVHEGGQQSEMQKFRKMAFGGEDSGESGMYSGEYNSREMPQRSQEYTSGELETRAINPRASQRY